MVPSLGEALRLGLSGLGRERWLVAVGLLVALLRRVLALPALALALLLALRGAWHGRAVAPAWAEAPLLGAAWTLSRPRTLALVVGLAACAGLLGWVLRLLLLAGALPTLAGAMGEAGPRPPRFAAGAARGLPRLLPTAALALALEWTGQLFAAGVAVAALRISGVAAGSGRVGLAAVVAGALVLSLLVLALTSTVAEAALVRTGVRGDGPVEAVLQAASRVLARPAASLLLALVFGLLSLTAGVAMQSVGGLAAGLTGQAPALLGLGPALMLSAAALAVAAALELWWLASLTVLTAREG
jgi:hypothetical protein